MVLFECSSQNATQLELKTSSEKKKEKNSYIFTLAGRHFEIEAIQTIKPDETTEEKQEKTPAYKIWTHPIFGQPRIVVPDVCCDHLQRLKDVVAKLFTNVCCTFASSQFMSVCFNLSSFQKIIEENISSKLLVLNIFIQIGKKLTWKGGLPKKFT